MGRYVSGSATAENTTEYSVICTGSIVVSTTPTPRTTIARTTRWNRAAFSGATIFPHAQPKYGATEYPTDSPVSSAAPYVVAKNPTSATHSPALPSTSATGSAASPSVDTWMPSGW